MLHLTSCLFATIVMHAFYAQDALYHHIYLVLTLTSLLYHTGHSAIWIRFIDVILAHTAVVVAVIRAPSWLLEVFPMAVICLWIAQNYVSREKADQLHVVLHLVTVVGIHVFIAMA